MDLDKVPTFPQLPIIAIITLQISAGFLEENARQNIFEIARRKGTAEYFQNPTEQRKGYCKSARPGLDLIIGMVGMCF